MTMNKNIAFNLALILFGMSSAYAATDFYSRIDQIEKGYSQTTSDANAAKIRVVLDELKKQAHDFDQDLVHGVPTDGHVKYRLAQELFLWDGKLAELEGLVKGSGAGHALLKDVLTVTVSIESLAVSNAADSGIYNDIKDSVVGRYRDYTNGFHPLENYKKILEALDGFTVPFKEISVLIAKARIPDGVTDATRTRFQEQLRILEAQMNVLQSTVDAAARADRLKVLSTIVDQAVAARKAEQQQYTDREMVTQMKGIIQMTRTDFSASAMAE